MHKYARVHIHIHIYYRYNTQIHGHSHTHMHKYYTLIQNNLIKTGNLQFTLHSVHLQGFLITSF